MATKSKKFLSRIKGLKIVVKSSTFGKPGKTITFNGFEYETMDKEEIEVLEKSSMFGSDIFLDKGKEEKEEGAGE